MKIVLGIVAIVVLAALALPLVNLAVGGPKGTAMTTATDAAASKVAAALEGKCANCHVPGTKVPLYAHLPVAKGLIEQDVKTGLKWMDLGRALAPADKGAPSLATANQIQRVIARGEMPPTRFTALHWDARVGSADRTLVEAWVRDVRKAAAPAGLPEALAAAPVHPIPAKVDTDARKVALGERLYHDKRLSGDDTISCATCHDLGKGGTDQLPVSVGIQGQKGGINSPTTFNALWQVKQFWDGRAGTLQDQAGGPPLNPVEMGATWAGIIAKLDADEGFAPEFKAVYPEGFTEKTITDAIAEFEKTLFTPNSAFDRFLLGDAAALTAEQKRGWAKFQEVGCDTCHAGRLLGGTSFEPLGRAADYFQDRGGLGEADQGRFNHTRDEGDRYRFKVPTLRNIALTFPYFHDAWPKDLATAVRHMARYQHGVQLSDAETADIVQFLGAQTGEWRGRKL